jgi:hypothetical protein
MSPAEMREHPATAGNPASRETRNLPAEVEIVAAPAMPIGAVVAETAAGIAAAGKREDEEFQ